MSGDATGFCTGAWGPAGEGNEQPQKWKQGRGSQSKLVMDMRGNYISTATSSVAAALFVKAHNDKVFDLWNKAAQEIEKLRDILKACEPFAEAWGAEDLLDRIRDALVKD